MLNGDVRCLVVVGAQWGDEGKGKIIDVLAKDADWIARYQGGANAGHTVKEPRHASTQRREDPDNSDGKAEADFGRGGSRAPDHGTPPHS